MYTTIPSPYICLFKAEFYSVTQAGFRLMGSHPDSVTHGLKLLILLLPGSQLLGLQVSTILPSLEFLLTVQNGCGMKPMKHTDFQQSKD